MADDYYTIEREAVTTGAGPATTLIRLQGEFDLGASQDLRDTLFAAVDARGEARIVVDLSGVEFFDSEAIGAVLDGYQAAGQAGIAFLLTGANGLVRRVFSIIGMDELFEPQKPQTDQMRSRRVSDGEMP